MPKPKPVRNWWITTEIDGRATTLAGGPRSKDGGFTLRIYQRDEGEIDTAAIIEGKIAHDGELLLIYEIAGNNGSYRTKR